MILYADFVVFLFHLKLKFYKISLVLWHPHQLTPMTFGSSQIVLLMCPQLVIVSHNTGTHTNPPLDCTYEGHFCHYILTKEEIVHTNRL